MTRLQETWRKHKKRQAFPADPTSNVRALRGIGVDHCIGFDKSPRLSSTKKTAAMLEKLRKQCWKGAHREPEEETEADDGNRWTTPEGVLYRPPVVD